jgi:hypothetical protein
LQKLLCPLTTALLTPTFGKIKLKAAGCGSKYGVLTQKCADGRPEINQKDSRIATNPID